MISLNPVFGFAYLIKIWGEKDGGEGRGVLTVTENILK